MASSEWKCMEMDEHIKYATEVVARDPMAVYLGIRIEEVRRAYARLSLHIKPQYQNALNRAHGIAICAIIDQSVAVAANATEYQALVVELKINYLGPVMPGETITAEATPLDLRRKIGIWRVKATISSGEQIAVAQAIVYHKRKEGS